MSGVLSAAGFNSETEVENFLSELNLTENNSIDYGAVVFDEESFDGDQVRRNTIIKYKIRMRAKGKGFNGHWRTDIMFPRIRNVGPRGDKFGGRQPGWSERYLAIATFVPLRQWFQL